MSAEEVKQIIGRAVVDADYRELLFSDPDEALEEYELTDEESSALKEIEREKFDAVAGELEERISRAGIGFGGFARPARPKLDPESTKILDDVMRNLGSDLGIVY